MKPPRPVVPLLLALAALAAVTALASAMGEAGPALPGPKERWLRLKTANFTLLTNGSDARAKEIGLDLERLRAVLARLRPNLSVSAPVPTTVYIFKSERSAAPYALTFGGKAEPERPYFRRAESGNAIVLTATWNTDPRPAVYHEFLHSFLASNFGRLPLWFDEGMADYYSTFRVSGRDARVGQVPRERLEQVREGPLLSLDELFAVRLDSREYHDPYRTSVFYGQSWALVHYLLHGFEGGAAALNRFLELERQGTPREAALRVSFKRTSRELLGELGRYVEGGRFAYVTYSLGDLAVPSAVATEELGYADALVWLGDLLAGRRDVPGPDAEAHYRAALDAVPGHPGALFGLASLRLAAGSAGEARDALKAASDAGGKDFRVPFRYGLLLLQSLEGRPYRPGKLEAAMLQTVHDARAAFQRSADLAPSFAEARARLGQTYLFEPGEKARPGIALLEEALAKMPDREDLALPLAELYERVGDGAKGEEVLKARFGAASAEAILAKRKKGSEPLAKIQSLLSDGKGEEAEPLLADLVARTEEPQWKAALEEQLADVRRVNAANRLVRKYNEAIELLDRREYEKARAAFAEVAAAALEPALAAAARERVDAIDHVLAAAKSAAGRKGR